MEKKQVPLQREESAKQENQLRSRVQILLQMLVALYLFYLGLVGIAELVQGVSTLHPAVAVGSSLVFGRLRNGDHCEKWQAFLADLVGKSEKYQAGRQINRPKK